MSALPEGLTAKCAVEDDIIQERREDSRPRRVVIRHHYGGALCRNIETGRTTTIHETTLARYVVVGHGGELWWPTTRVLG